MYKNSLHISQYTLWLVLSFTFCSIWLLFQSHVYCRLHGILQARILEWWTFPISMGPSQPRGQTQVSCPAGGYFTIKPEGKPKNPRCLSYPISSRSSQARTHTGVSCIAGGFFTNWAIKEAPQFRSVQSLSHVWLFVTPWTVAKQASLSSTKTPSLLKLMSIESVMPSNYLISVIPFSSRLQSFPASGSFPMSQFFASGGQSIGASASVSPSNAYSGLISFRTEWFDLLAVQGTLKSLL